MFRRLRSAGHLSQNTRSPPHGAGRDTLGFTVCCCTIGRVTVQPLVAIPSRCTFTANPKLESPSSSWGNTSAHVSMSTVERCHVSAGTFLVMGCIAASSDGNRTCGNEITRPMERPSSMRSADQRMKHDNSIALAQRAPLAVNMLSKSFAVFRETRECKQSVAQIGAQGRHVETQQDELPSCFLWHRLLSCRFSRVLQCRGEINNPQGSDNVDVESDS
ncbi:hypothetical protein EDD15DRAFT_1887033 [Pisolithus albus]|nr:hypothetical protein EDD15DRAFT_1887033 [Pisolithus albus]